MLPANGKPSPSMIFHRDSEVVLESQVAFGAAVKFIKWPEQRDSKFGEHARAGSFRGPSRESLDETPKLCWVVTTREDGGKEMATVHMGCVRVDERPVIARTTLSHPSHQPFDDPQVERPVDREPDELDFTMWRDVAAEGCPDDMDPSRYEGMTVLTSLVVSAVESVSGILVPKGDKREPWACTCYHVGARARSTEHGCRRRRWPIDSALIHATNLERNRGPTHCEPTPTVN